MQRWKNRAWNLLRNYGEDVLLLALMAWLMPFIHARLLLPEIFPRLHQNFVYLVACLLLLDVLLQYFYIRMASYWMRQSFSGSILLAVLSFLRMVSVFPLFLLDKEAGNFVTVVVAIWFLGHLFYTYLMFEPGEALQRLESPLWLYVIVRTLLFCSMFCLILIGYTAMHDSGSLDLALIRERPSEAIAFFFLAIMLYVPNRFYEFVSEVLAHQDTTAIGRYILRIVGIWTLVILEIGSYDPKILDTALEHASNPAVVTRLDLSNSDLSRISEIGQFTHLKELRLKANQLEKVPPDVFTLTSLEILLLSRNKLESLSPQLAHLRNLKILAINDNRFYRIPESVFQLPVLEELDLRQNQLSQIPGDISKVSTLKILDLRENHLRSLPPELANIYLQEMYLHDNPLDQLNQEMHAKLKSRSGVYW